MSTAEVDDICSYDYASLTPPAGNDAGYSCPDAGLYNFHVNYDLWGSPDSWYATTYGYSMGVSLHIYDTLNDIEFASCYVEVVAKKGSEDYTWTSAALFFPAAVGVTGLTAGYMMRKRRVGLIDLEKEETSSNFELINDPSTGV